MKNILLLHGAIGTKDQLADLELALSKTHVVHRLNFNGHGDSPSSGPDFSIADFANDVLEYLEEKKIDATNIFGYSMGGYVALYLAKHHPNFVNNIVTLATKFKWDESIAADEVNRLQPEKIEEKLPAFADILRSRHAYNGWKKVLEKTAELLLNMGKENPLKKADYHLINHRVLLLRGEKDKMVTQEETDEIFKLLPNAQTLSLPKTPHPIEAVNPLNLAEIITHFIEKDKLL